MAADRRIPAGVKFEIETQDSGSLSSGGAREFALGLTDSTWSSTNRY